MQQESKIVEKLEEIVSDKNKSSNVDPTANVLKLVELSVKRLDDLALNNNTNVREIIYLNKEILNLHILYQKELSLAESKRIDAIRAVDVGAVAIASERAAGQASVLANQVSASAETLRNLVAQTATTAATQFGQVTSQMMERISILEKGQYESRGTGHGRTQGSKDVMDIIKLVIIVAAFMLAYFVLK